MSAKSKKTKSNYEVKNITIPVPKKMVCLTTVMIYEETNGTFSINTLSYGTKELKELGWNDENI